MCFGLEAPPPRQGFGAPKGPRDLSFFGSSEHPPVVPGPAMEQGAAQLLSPPGTGGSRREWGVLPAGCRRRCGPTQQGCLLTAPFSHCATSGELLAPLCLLHL